MAIKTTGAEYKRFSEDKSAWPEDDGKTYVDGECLLVDEAEWGTELGVDAIPDTATVHIADGWVFRPDADEPIKLETYFKRWLKRQSSVNFVVECDVASLDAVKAAIKAAGGKIR